MRIFNLQGRYGPPSGSFGISRSIHQRHGSVRVFWIEWDIWPSSEEAAGVGRLFQRRGKLEKGVEGLVLHTLGESLAPRAHARAGDQPPPTPRLMLRVSGFVWGFALGSCLGRAQVWKGLFFYFVVPGPLPVHEPHHRPA